MIYIIGTGAIGRALAVSLHHRGKDVMLIRGSVDQEMTAAETIKLKFADGRELASTLSIRTFSQLTTIDGPILVATKSYGNQKLAEKLSALGGQDHPIMLLQNGLEIEQPFMVGGFEHLFRCVLMVTSQFEPDGTIRFRPVAACPVGTVIGSTIALNNLLEQLENPWFKFVGEESIQPLIWKKVIINCIFNTICPLLDTHNGIFYRNQEALILARRIIRECLDIASHCGIALTADEIESTLLSISRAADGQFISTLQDIRNGRETEIGTLNGAIARIAATAGKANLVTETRLLGELTLIKSKLNLLT